MYVIQNWINGRAGGTPFSADRFNHMEAGILAASQVADAAVASVNGRTGVVVLTAADVSSGNFPAGTFNFTGTLQEAGNRVYSAGNPPPYPVTSVAARTGAVVLTAADIGAGTFPGSVTFNQGFATIFSTASGGAGYVKGSGTQLVLRGGSTGLAIRNNADSINTVTISDTGTINSTQDGFFNGARIGGSSVDVGFYYDGNNAAVRTSATGGVYIQSNNGTFTYGLFGQNNTNLGLTAQAITMIPLILTGTTGQTADLFRAYDTPGGTVLASIDKNGLLTINGNIAGTGSLTLNGVTQGIEHGAQGVVNTPYFDWHSSSTANDYDVRLQASGGTTSSGQGQLTMWGGLKINGANPSYTLQLTQDSSLGLLHGPEIAFQDLKVGQATPNKFIRAIGGILQILNNAYTTAIWQIDDSGNETITGGLSLSPVTTTTAPTGGAAGALPANPVGYMSITINGTVRKIPYYA